MISNLAVKLNWYRQSELEGALMLGRLVGRVGDARLITKLTKHCAEEAEHSRIWMETIGALGLTVVRIKRSYQSFYLDHSGVPGSVLEVLCFTQIFERRVHRRFSEEERAPETPEAVRRAYRKMIEDEKDHLGWVAEWLRGQPGAAECLRHYQEIDRRVFEEIRPYEGCLRTVPGLCDETMEETVTQ
jgi:tRNA isopentenyl-2-thiomethyl-A-37 hydroxylase MiaE